MMVNAYRAAFETRRIYVGEDVTPEQPFGRPASHPEIWYTYLRDADAARDVAHAGALTPITMRLTTRRKHLLDNIETYDIGDFTISDRVRKIIEAHEPGQHYFFRCNILKSDWSAWPEQYWVFKAGPSAVVQALIVEQSSRLAWKPYAPERFNLCVNTGRMKLALTSMLAAAADFPGGMTVDEAAFVERHIVKERVYAFRKPLFLSDALYAALKRAKVTGFKFCRVNAAKRLVPPYGASNGIGGVTLLETVERITPLALGPQLRRRR